MSEEEKVKDPIRGDHHKLFIRPETLQEGFKELEKDIDVTTHQNKAIIGILERLEKQLTAQDLYLAQKLLELGKIIEKQLSITSDTFKSIDIRANAIEKLIREENKSRFKIIEEYFLMLQREWAWIKNAMPEISELKKAIHFLDKEKEDPEPTLSEKIKNDDKVIMKGIHNVVWNVFRRTVTQGGEKDRFTISLSMVDDPESNMYINSDFFNEHFEEMKE